MDTKTDIILRTNGIVGGYGRTTILHGTTIEVPRAKLTTVIGPNGAGKSTLFKALFGMLNIREGTVTLDGKDITHLSPMEKLQHGIAYVPQGRNIFPELSVEHNLEFGGVSLRDLKETRRRMEKVMDQFPILRKGPRPRPAPLAGVNRRCLRLGGPYSLTQSYCSSTNHPLGSLPIW